jgi:hypothetical protein
MTGGFEDNDIDQGVKIDFTDNYLHLKNSNKLY